MAARSIVVLALLVASGEWTDTRGASADARTPSPQGPPGPPSVPPAALLLVCCDDAAGWGPTGGSQGQRRGGRSPGRVGCRQPPAAAVRLARAPPPLQAPPPLCTHAPPPSPRRRPPPSAPTRTRGPRALRGAWHGPPPGPHLREALLTPPTHTHTRTHAHPAASYALAGKKISEANYDDVPTYVVDAPAPLPVSVRPRGRAA